MSITFMGIVWFAIGIILLFLPIKYLKAFVIMSMCFQGTTCFAVNATETDIRAVAVAILFLTMKWLIEVIRYKRKLVINERVCSLWLFCIVAVLLSCITTQLFAGYQVYAVGYWAGHVTYTPKGVYFDTALFVQFLYLFLYAWAYLIIAQPTDGEDTSFYYRMLDIMIGIVFFFGIWQWLESNAYINTGFIQATVHNAIYHTSGDAFINNYDRLMSIFAEPSYCGAWLAAMLWYKLAKRGWSVKDVISFVALCILFVLSMSGTGLATMAVSSIFYFTQRSKKEWRKYILIALVAILFVISTPIGRELVSQGLNKMSTSSGAVRTANDALCLQAFADTYGLGVGYSKIQGMTIFGLMLGQVGIIGSILFIVFVWKTLKRRSYMGRSKEYYDQARMMLIIVWISCCFSMSGVYYNAVMWFGFYFYEVVLGTLGAESMIDETVGVTHRNKIHVRAGAKVSRTQKG